MACLASSSRTSRPPREPNGPNEIVNLAQAEAALAAGPNEEGQYTVINFSDPEGANDGNFGGGVPFPNDTPVDDQDFGVMVTAALDIPDGRNV